MDVPSESSTYDYDPGEGGNLSSSQRKPFIDTDPLSELVWSPMKGLCIKCADGTDSREQTYNKWLRGPPKRPFHSETMKDNPFDSNPVNNFYPPTEKIPGSIRDSSQGRVLKLQSSKKRKLRSELGSSKSYNPSPLGKSNLTVKNDVIPVESSKGNLTGDLKGPFPNESSNQTDIRVIYETKKLNYSLRDSSSFGRHTSFMMWISNMFKDHENKNPKPLFGSSPSSSFRPYHEDERGVSTMMLLPPDNDAKRVILGNHATTSGSVDVSSSWITRYNPSKLVITNLPRKFTSLDVIFEGVMKLQISRAEIMKCMQLQMPVSSLEGCFLRLRLAKWSVARYLVAIISGIGETIGEEAKVSIGVEVNGVHCRVECQYISNQMIREDELRAWWSATSERGGEVPSEEELKLKLERKKLLGILI